MRLRLTNLLVIFLLLIAAPSWATVAVVQKGVAASASPCVTSAITVTAGNALIFVHSNASGAVSTLASSPSNTWNLAVAKFDGVSDVEIWYAMNVAGGSTTVTDTPASGTPRCNVYEVSGAALTNLLDKTASASGASSTPLTGTTATVGQADEIAFGVIRTASSQSAFSSIAGTIGTWTSEALGTLGEDGFNIGGSVGTYGGQETGTPATWAGVVASFKGVPPPTTSDETINEIIMSNP